MLRQAVNRGFRAAANPNGRKNPVQSRTFLSRSGGGSSGGGRSSVFSQEQHQFVQADVGHAPVVAGVAFVGTWFVCFTTPSLWTYQMRGEESTENKELGGSELKRLRALKKEHAEQIPVSSSIKRQDSWKEVDTTKRQSFTWADRYGQPVDSPDSLKEQEMAIGTGWSLRKMLVGERNAAGLGANDNRETFAPDHQSPGSFQRKKSITDVNGISFTSADGNMKMQRKASKKNPA